MTDNRTNEPTEAQVEAAAKAMWDLRKLISDPEWDALEYGVKLEYRKDARAALVAAAPIPQPVIDEAALAEVIADAPHSGDPNVSCLDPRCKAAAVAAWLREGVAPQEPSQTETKSGNNFVSLDPEKVAELIEQLRDRSRKERDVAKESLGHFIARALCEAYTEGKLT